MSMVVFTCEQGTIIIASQNSFQHSYRSFNSRIACNGVKIHRCIGGTIFYLSRFGNRQIESNFTGMDTTEVGA
jgi:hypothetical protein